MKQWTFLVTLTEGSDEFWEEEPSAEDLREFVTNLLYYESGLHEDNCQVSIAGQVDTAEPDALTESLHFAASTLGHLRETFQSLPDDLKAAILGTK